MLDDSRFSAHASATEHTDELNIAERLGAGLLRRMSHREHSAVARWPAGVLSRVRRLERAVVIQAALLGALAGAILGAVELGLVAWQGVDRGGEGLAGQWRYWLVYLGAALLVSMIEIGLMYWRILAAVARIGSLAGLDLSREDAERILSLGLSRAALDIPNPRAPFFGIDPYARQPRWKLLLLAVAYRLKVGATSVVLRLLLRRLLAPSRYMRCGMQSWSPGSCARRVIAWLGRWPLTSSGASFGRIARNSRRQAAKQSSQRSPKASHWHRMRIPTMCCWSAQSWTGLTSTLQRWPGNGHRAGTA
jgi:hypothetical protein